MSWGVFPDGRAGCLLYSTLYWSPHPLTLWSLLFSTLYWSLLHSLDNIWSLLHWTPSRVSSSRPSTGVFFTWLSGVFFAQLSTGVFTWPSGVFFTRPSTGVFFTWPYLESFSLDPLWSLLFSTLYWSLLHLTLWSLLCSTLYWSLLHLTLSGVSFDRLSTGIF
jgi:hypothetical protein